MDLQGLPLRPWAGIGAGALGFLLAGAPLGAAGTTAADFLNARTSARAAGMGEAYSALGDDVPVLIYQPAGLASLKGPSVSFLHYAQVEGINVEDVAYGQPFDFGTLAAALLYRSQPVINNPLATDAPVAASDLSLGVSWAGRISRWLNMLPASLDQADAGVTLKYITSHLGTRDAWSVALDAGLRVPLGQGITGSVSLLNVGPGMTFIAVTDPLPSSLVAGLSRSFDPIFENQFNLAADLDLPFASEMSLHLGVEDWLGKSLALRLGYILGTGQSLNGLTTGLGLRLNQDGLIFSVDYALRPLYYDGFNSIDAQQLFQMTLTF